MGNLADPAPAGDMIAEPPKTVVDEEVTVESVFGETADEPKEG
jgi:hypothetical protein